MEIREPAGSGESRNLALQLAETLRSSGHEVFYVGGCVRDRLLGRAVHDYDLTTDAPPSRLLKLLPDAIEVGASFGVVLVRRGGNQVQVATYRSDQAYLDGRRPEEVRFETDVREDVRRRDFTVNALLEDPFSGQIFDHAGGRNDLESGLIRAIGEPAARFAEDHLRMLRAVRFAARLGFEIEARTKEAIHRLSAHIRKISAERIRDELSRILTEGGARRGFDLLDQTGLLNELLPEVAQMKGVEQPPSHHPEGDVWRHTLGLLGMLQQPSLELAWAALLHDVAKPVTQTYEDRIRFTGHEREGARMSREILNRLKYPGGVVDAVAEMVMNHMRFKDVERMGESAFKRFVRLEHFEELTELYRLDLLAADRSLVNYELTLERRKAISEEQLHPEPLLKGRDLMAMGYPPGPLFTEILTALEEEQLAGRIGSRVQAQEWVKRTWPPAST